MYHCTCCNKRRFNLQVEKKPFTHKLSIPSRSLFQVMGLGVFARDLYCESRDKTIPQKIPWWNPMLVCKKFFSYPVNWIVVYYITMTGLRNLFLPKKANLVSQLIWLMIQLLSAHCTLWGMFQRCLESNKKNRTTRKKNITLRIFASVPKNQLGYSVIKISCPGK